MYLLSKQMGPIQSKAEVFKEIYDYGMLLKNAYTEAQFFYVVRLLLCLDIGYNQRSGYG